MQLSFWISFTSAGLLFLLIFLYNVIVAIRYELVETNQQNYYLAAWKWYALKLFRLEDINSIQHVLDVLDVDCTSVMGKRCTCKGMRSGTHLVNILELLKILRSVYN